MAQEPRHFSIVCAGRCGSTRLYQVLRAHPRLAMTNEAGVLHFLHFCANFAGVPQFAEARLPPIHGFPVRGLLSEAARARLVPMFSARVRELARRFYDEHFAGREFQWWGEKMLDPRVAYDLQEHFEGTRYVLLVRDPRDVLCSRRSYAARRLERFEEDPVAATIADPEQRARERERLAHLAAWPAAEHAGVWHGVYEDVGPRLRDTLVVRYEDFVDDPVREVGRILGHLGLEPDDAVDRALATDGGVERHGTAGSVDRSVGRWRSDLDAADVEEVERRCAAGMARYGYAPSGGG